MFLQKLYEKKKKNMRQKILKWLTAFCSCIVLLLLCGINAQASEDIATDDSWVAGNTEESEVNYYTFSITSAGRVAVTYQSYMRYGKCALYDKDLIHKYKDVNVSGSDVSLSTEQFSADLKAGAYSLKLSD